MLYTYMEMPDPATTSQRHVVVFFRLRFQVVCGHSPGHVLPVGGIRDKVLTWGAAG